MAIIVIAHNIRSAHNVGSIIRSCEGFGVGALYCTGYTPYPRLTGDTRLPHIANKMTTAVAKTALGAEVMIPIHHGELSDVIESLQTQAYTVVGLEQTKASSNISHYTPPKKLALLLGEERYGLDVASQALCDELVEIPMLGAKESFNVAVAAGIALYAFTNNIVQ